MEDENALYNSRKSRMTSSEVFTSSNVLDALDSGKATDLEGTKQDSNVKVSQFKGSSSSINKGNTQLYSIFLFEYVCIYKSQQHMYHIVLIQKIIY